MAKLVFISWSGDNSKRVALALRHWIQILLPNVEAWMSECDLAAGARWQDEINAKLEKGSFGIICVTPENKDRPWLLYEAGALAKLLSSAQVCPYLIGLGKHELSAPLVQFQAVRADKDGTAKLVTSLNSSLEKNRQKPSGELAKDFTAQWRKLSRALAPPTAAAKQAAASQLLEIRDNVERAAQSPVILRAFFGMETFMSRFGTADSCRASRFPTRNLIRSVPSTTKMSTKKC